jgi:hypothetical protein
VSGTHAIAVELGASRSVDHTAGQSGTWRIPMNMARRLGTRLTCVGLIAAATAGAHAQLLNPSFETAGTGGAVFGNWIDFGNSIPNINRSSEVVRTGSFAAKMFGQFSGDFNVSGFFQDRPTTRDQLWNAEGFFQNRTADPMRIGNIVAMNVEFRASNGDLLEYWTVDALTSTSPRDTWIQQQVAATAPDDATVARLVFLFIQPDIEAGAGHIDDASLSSPGSSGLLINPGFEDFGGFGAAHSARGWGQFPRFASNIFRNSDVPQTGGFAGFMFGQFNGADNFNGFYQSFDVAPGQRVDAEVFARHKSTDRLTGTNYGFINLEFYNSAGAIIGDILTNPGINATSPTNTYISMPISGIAPTGAVRVRLVIGMFQGYTAGVGGGGGVHFDDASLAISSAPVFCQGNANGDGEVSFADITSVLANFGNGYTPGSAGAGDANNDGIVNFTDITTVLANFGTSCA